MTGSVTDQAILNFHDGVPSAWMTVLDGRPHLHWMILGYVEPFEIWVDLELPWEEADLLLSAHADLIDDVVARCGGIPVILRFMLSGDDQEFIRIELPKPQGRLTVNWAIQTLCAAIDSDARQARQRGNFSRASESESTLALINAA
jgi:hypothetical protein